MITDGKFGDKSAEEVQDCFEEYTEEGIQVIYLAIGEKAVVYESDPDNGLYCYQASSSEDILSEMTEISNLISARLDLGADEDYFNDHVTETEDGLEIELDVPMSEIIIFAQGSDVSIGAMSSDACEISVSSEVEVTSCEYTEEMKEKKESVKNADLSGVVKTFTGKGGVTMGAGTYTVKVSGADLEDIKLYYTPKVSVAMTVTQDGEKVSEGAYLTPGEEVQIEAYLVDENGARIESELLKNIKVSCDITSGGETTTLESGGEAVTYTPESEDLSVTATVSVEESGIKETTEEFKAGIKEVLDGLTVEADDTVTFEKEYLAKNDDTFLVTVRENGELLSKADWKETDLSIETDKTNSCLSFDWERGEDVSTYVVTVHYDAEADSHTDWKDETVQCTIKAELNTEAKSDTGETVTTVTAQKLPLTEILKKYWKQLLAILIILIILIGYIPGIKKRFPRSLKKKPAGREVPISGIGKTENYTGKFQKKFVTVILPYVHEKGTLRYLKPGVPGSKMQLRAVGRSSMEITNAARFAGKNIKFNGEKVEPGKKKYKIPAHTSIRADVNGRRYTCQL